MIEEEKNVTPVGRIERINIEDHMKESYINYSMSVIVSRALPDVRDGLKPVHRRILFDMDSQLHLYHDKPTRKSARIVGDVLGKFHPHGDASVYDAMVRLAQPWAMRYPLVEGQGNFGSMDGDSPAAMRYTEARMQKITNEVMADIDKDTIDWTMNFDDTQKEPTVLPTKIPLLLVNGASGIAVGMATNMPCNSSGKSPYPGLKRGQRTLPFFVFCSAISRLNASHSASMRSAPIAWKKRALVADTALYLVMRRSGSKPTVAAKRTKLSQPERFFFKSFDKILANPKSSASPHTDTGSSQ